MNNYWNSIPTWIRAILIGFLFLFPIVTVIQLTIFKNIVYLPDLPWSTLVAFILLGLYYQFSSGHKFPFGASSFRHKYGGLHPLQSYSFSAYCKMGLSLLMFIFATSSIGFAFCNPEYTVQFATIKQIGEAPSRTAILLYFALALTAGIVEEIVFRGFIQRMMIEKYGVTVAFLFVAILFTLVHFLPPALFLPYFLISLALSWVAYITGSVIIGIIIHTAFDFIAFLFVYYGAIYIDADYLDTNLLTHVLIALVCVLLLWYQGRKLSDPKSHEVS